MLRRAWIIIIILGAIVAVTLGASAAKMAGSLDQRVATRMAQIDGLQDAR